MRTQEKRAIYKPGREASGGTNSADTLVSNFQPPGLWENGLLLLEPCSAAPCYRSTRNKCSSPAAWTASLVPKARVQTGPTLGPKLGSQGDGAWSASRVGVREGPGGSEWVGGYDLDGVLGRSLLDPCSLFPPQWREWLPLPGPCKGLPQGRCPP